MPVGTLHYRFKYNPHHNRLKVSIFYFKEYCVCEMVALKQVCVSSLLVLVVALEKVERSSGSLIGSSIASIQKSTAPEVIS